MKLHFGRILTMAWYCQQQLLVHGVSAGGGENEEEEKAKLRPSAEWLDAFYSNVDNVLTEASLTPRASDLPDLPEYVSSPTNNKTQEESGPTTTRPPYGRKLGRLQDRQLQGQGTATILLNEEGLTFQSVPVPDTVGDVGTDHYVQMTNTFSGSAVRVMNKNNGSLNKTFVLDGLGGTGDCAIGFGDPIVLFDQWASRWFLSEFSEDGNKLCVYISTSDDASGTYHRYEFAAPAFPDYPKYGVWNDAYYVGTNEGGTPVMYALERSKMLTGAPAKIL